MAPVTLITYGGKALLVGGKPLRQKRWSDLVAWTHSWDAEDADTYADTGAAWSISPATRINQIEDRGSGNKPMVRDQGAYAITVFGNAAPYPGPRFISSSARFNGRAALRTDLLIAAGTFSQFTMLTPNVNPGPSDGSYPSEWFNAPTGYAQPYVVMLLARPVVDGFSAVGVWDSQHGGLGTGPTLGSGVGTGTKWTASTYGPTPHWTCNSTRDYSANETVCIVAYCNGASSFIEVSWREATGKNLNTARVNGTIDNFTYKECFFGWVHGSYVSACGIKLGTINEADVTAVRDWCGGYLPPTGSIADEP